MIRSAVTVCLVPEARSGPFVFHQELEPACAAARALQFDAVEVFAPSARQLPLSTLQSAIQRYSITIAAIGSGAGWVREKLSLTDPDPDIRTRARSFIMGLVNLGGFVGAPVIVGSMQGRIADPTERAQALDWLADELRELSTRAASHGQVLLYEPLNRYETNLFNRLADAAAFLEQRDLPSVKILADLFHMNLEEQDLPAALRHLGPRLGHVHFADSNRRAIGFGHTPVGPIAAALHDVQYQGFLSAEILPWPDSEGAARQTIESFRHWFHPSHSPQPQSP